MSTRDELAELLFDAQHPEGFWMDGNSQPPTASYEDMADALIAEGWRKKPSEAEVREAIGPAHRRIWLDPEDIEEMVADVLALMDRGQ